MLDLRIDCSSWCLFVSVGMNGMALGICGMGSLQGDVHLTIYLVTFIEFR